MRELNKREKNLGFLVVVAMGSMLLWFQSRTAERRLIEVSEELRAASERVRFAEESLKELQKPLEDAKPKTVEAKARPPEGPAVVRLLNDITVPPEIGQLKIVSVAKGDQGAYLMSVEGRFADMMRFVSFLERDGSKFGVASLSVNRVAEDPLKPPTRKIRAQLNLFAKG